MDTRDDPRSTGGMVTPRTALAQVGATDAVSHGRGAFYVKPTHPLLLVGVSDPQIIDNYVVSAREAGLDVHIEPNPEDAPAWLEEHDPVAIAVDMMAEGAEASCLAVRSIARLANVPVLGLVPELSDLAFPEIYGWGGDDVVPIASPRSLVPRLRWLAADASLHPPAARGVVLVADADRRRRVLWARVLRSAGYDVRYALDGDEAYRSAHDHAVKLVIADVDIDPHGGVAVAQQMRAAGIGTPVVLPCAPKRIGHYRSALADLRKVAVTDGFAPPENLLFVANELGRSGLEGRASPRLLYGTVVAFRQAGRDEDAFGCTYNISAGGLYVRTLAPLNGDEDVWLELKPPRSDRRVRLEGRVRWRRRFGPIESATVPPGFGVQIVDGAKADLIRYETGYQSFAADTFGTS
jgi:DNA-binding response OmpR family regulator/Tfp pilus assembly protein PilZ